MHQTIILSDPISEVTVDKSVAIEGIEIRAGETDVLRIDVLGRGDLFFHHLRLAVDDYFRTREQDALEQADLAARSSRGISL